MFPAGAHTENTYIYHIYIHTYTHTHIYIYMVGHRSDRYAEHPHEHREHRQPHPAPLSGWTGWRSSGENIYIHMYYVGPSSSCVYSVCPVAAPGSQSLQLLAPVHTGPRSRCPTPVAGTDSHTNTAGLNEFISATAILHQDWRTLLLAGDLKQFKLQTRKPLFSCHQLQAPHINTQNRPSVQSTAIYLTPKPDQN